MENEHETPQTDLQQTPPETATPAVMPPPEKMEEAITALLSYLGEGDNVFTRAASEQSVNEFITAVHDYEPQAFADILTGNVSMLNTTFQQNLLASIRSQKYGHGALVNAMRAQNQIVRSVDTWRRLKEFENRQTK